ncbi:MAG: AMP-dependent synthetase/ligase [bacterium]
MNAKKLKRGKYRDGIGIFTIRELVERASREFAKRPFFKWRVGDESDFDFITYGQFYNRLVNIATGLYSLGLTKGDQIAIVGKNSENWATSFLTVISAGIIAVPLDANLKPQERAGIINQSDVKAVISSNDFIDEFKDRGAFNKNFIIISMEDGEITLNSLEDGGKKLRMAGDRTYEDVVVSLDDIAEIIFTSGTTGASKGVVLTHRNLGANVNQIYQALPYSYDDTFLSLLPLHHTFESTAGLLVPISGGSSIIYAKSYKSTEIIETIKNASVTMICGIPRLYQSIAKAILKAIDEQMFLKRILIKSLIAIVRFVKRAFGWNWGGVLFSSLRRKAGFSTIRMFISGAAPLPSEVGELFQTLGFRLLQGYGLTEASPVVSVNPYIGWRPETIGYVLPGVEVIVDEPDENGVGELWVRGDNVMVGYYKNKEATDGAIVNGWLKTGDLGFIDDEGHIHITGRLKNLIKTASGKNIYPEEIELILTGSPKIEDVVVIPIENIRTGREEVGAIVYPDIEYFLALMGEGGVDRDVIKREIVIEVREMMRRIADFKRVRSIAITFDGFEKTSTLKVKRHLLDKDKFEIIDSG